MKRKVQKNNVSYFEAGFKAALLVFGGMNEAEIKRRFYSNILYPNMVRQCLKYYDMKEDDTSGTEYMLQNI